MLKLKSARECIKIAQTDPAWQGLTGRKIPTNPTQMKNIREEATTLEEQQQMGSDMRTNDQLKQDMMGRTPANKEVSGHDGANAATQSVDPAQAVQQLQQAMSAFSKSFKGQYRQFQPLWTQVQGTIKGLNQVMQAGMLLPPEAQSAISMLATTLQNAVAEEAQDQQIMNKLIQQSQEVVNQIGGFGKFAPQKQQPTKRTKQPKAQTPQIVQPDPSGGKGWGTGIGDIMRNIINIPGNIGRGWQQAAEGWQPILTAGVASARQMLK